MAYKNPFNIIVTRISTTRHHLRKSKERHGITSSYTSTFGDGRKMKSLVTHTNITDEFVVRNLVKWLKTLPLYDTVNFWNFENLEDFHKDFFLKMVQKFVARMKILNTPLHSLQNYMKNVYKVGIILSIPTISLQSNILDSTRFCKYSLLLAS